MPTRADDGARKPVRVLVVQRNPDQAVETALLLEAARFVVCGICLTGAGALRAASLLDPDMLLVEVSLYNGHDGISTAPALRARSRRTCIIFLTGYDGEAAARVRAFRPEAHLLKTMHSKELEAAVIRALETGADA